MPAKSWNVEDVRGRIDGFLEPVLQKAGLDVAYRISEGRADDHELITPDVTVEFEGPDCGLLLAHRGELLLALEHLTLEALKTPHEDRFRLVFDAQDYRLLRIEELRLTAQAAADKVKRTGAPFHFQPMTSRERRVIHLALRDDHAVRTTSEGVAPRRYTVIYPADK
jgi:spoIIIJ-associated protein